MEFNQIQVEKIINETVDTKTFYFSPRTEKYQFKSGQYVTVAATIDNNEIRRSYSLCTAPKEDLLGFTVKRVKGGKMSNYLHDQIAEHDQISISLPEGKFVLVPDPESQHDYYFIAAGSGITPIMSMIKSVLEDEPLSTCYLLYGSRNEDQIIFNAVLEDLQKKYSDQLFVTHCLSQPNKKSASGLSGLLGRSVVNWKGEKGRITLDKLKGFLSSNPSRSGRSFYYLCGPGNMIELCKEYLFSQGEIKENIKAEFFSSASESVEEGASGKVKIILDKKEYEISVQEDETILEAALREKIDAPYSCTSGACSSCLAKINSGDVKMDACYALEDDEIADGYILTCQSRLVTDQAEITYDV